MTVGKLKTSDMGKLKYIFYFFRPEYMIISGIFAFLVGCGVLILIIKSVLILIIKSINSICFYDIIVLLLNVEYIVFYLGFLMKQ